MLACTYNILNIITISMNTMLLPAKGKQAPMETPPQDIEDDLAWSKVRLESGHDWISNPRPVVMSF
jgi:hypothetical protein